MGWRYWVVWLAMGCAGGQMDAAKQPSHDLRIVQHELEPVLAAGTLISVPVVVANDGVVPWVPEKGFALSYHWLDADSEIASWDGLRTPFPGPVVSGASARVVATVEVPLRPGHYRLVWDVVHEGVLWISEVDPTPVEGIPVSVEADYGFTIVDASGPRFMAASSDAKVRVGLENHGSRTWPADGSTALSYHWLDLSGDVVEWDGRRRAFPHEVRCGETVAVQAILEAPPRAGVYRLQWDLVEEGVCWFSERAAEPPPTRLVVVAPDPLASPGWWALLVLLAAAAAVSVLVRGGPGPLMALFAVGDLLWCVGSLAVKQGFVLAEVGARATGTGWLLIWGGAAALVLLATVLPRRFRPWACWTLVAAGTLIMWGDAVYLRFFGDLPSPAALAAAGQLGRVEASLRDLLALRDLWMWLDLLPGLVLVLVAGRLQRGCSPRPRWIATAALLTAVMAGAGAGIHLFATEPGLLRQMFRRVTVAREVGLLNLHAIDGGRHLVRMARRPELDPDRFREAVAWFRGRAPLRAGSGPWFGAAEGANLVMVQVESLQGFVIGLEINGVEVTPFLNRWTETALYFPDLTDQTGQGRSSDSELATQVSLLPLAGGAAAFRFPGNDFTGLAEVLAERGYHTLSAVPFDGAFWNRRLTHPAFGYARSLFVDDFAAGETIGWGLNDGDFLSQVTGQLAAAERPFCAYLLTLSLHHPFVGFPEHLKVLDVDPWQDTPFGNFLHTMHFFDASLASFVAGLEREGLAESTVIAVWGDHDAGFRWRPEIAGAMGVGHDPAGWYLSQEVPLFIRVPGSEAPRGELRLAAGHTDVAPTLLALCGVDPAPYAYVGRNLLGAAADVPVVGEYGCWRDARHLFLQGGGTLEEGSCIELATLQTVAPAECAAAFSEARRIEVVSSLVLEYDLQGTIYRELSGEGEVER